MWNSNQADSRVYLDSSHFLFLLSGEAFPIATLSQVAISLFTDIYGPSWREDCYVPVLLMSGLAMWLSLPN